MQFISVAPMALSSFPDNPRSRHSSEYYSTLITQLQHFIAKEPGFFGHRGGTCISNQVMIVLREGQRRSVTAENIEGEILQREIPI